MSGLSSIISAAALCIIISLVCKTVEPSSKEIAMTLVLALTGFMLFSAMKELSSVILTITRLANKAQLDPGFASVIFKSMGVCFVTNFAADCCRDCGEQAIANGLELLGRITLAALSLPLLSAAAAIVEALIT